MPHGRVVWVVRIHHKYAPWDDPFHPRKTPFEMLWRTSAGDDSIRDLHQQCFFSSHIFEKTESFHRSGRFVSDFYTKLFLTQWIWGNKISTALSKEIFLSSGNLNRLTLATSQHPAWGNYRSLSYPLTWKTAIATLTVNFHQLETPTTRHFQECLKKKQFTRNLIQM